MADSAPEPLTQGECRISHEEEEEIILGTRFVFTGQPTLHEWFVYRLNGNHYIAAWWAGWFAGHPMPSWYMQFMFEGCDE